MRPPLAVLALVLLVPLAQAKEITIHAGTMSDGSLYFQPSRLNAGEGERIGLTLVNDDADKPHDWALLDYGGRDIEAYARAGESRSIGFTANEVGTFRIVCQVVGHKQLGMEGALTVEDKLLVPDAPLFLSLAAFVGALGRRSR